MNKLQQVNLRPQMNLELTFAESRRSDGDGAASGRLLSIPSSHAPFFRGCIEPVFEHSFAAGQLDLEWDSVKQRKGLKTFAEGYWLGPWFHGKEITNT